MANAILTQDQIKNLFSYNPDTGLFTRIKKTSSTARVGDVLSHLKAGYICTSILGVTYRVHRLAFVYMNGEWPEFDVDHINGDPSDNRWANLRSATRTQNNQNQSEARSNSSTGYLGVSKSKNKFEARIVIDGKKRHIGNFSTAELAHAAYLEVKRKSHSHCEI